MNSETAIRILINTIRELTDLVGKPEGAKPRSVATPKPQPRKPATASQHTGKWREFPPDVLKACRSIKYRAKQRKLDVVQFVRNPDLCEKRTTLQLKLKPNVKDYLLKWSAKAKKDSSIRARFDMADLNRNGKPTQKGGNNGK